MAITETIGVEITVHRVGGPDVPPDEPGARYGWERTYGGRAFPLQVMDGPENRVQAVDALGCSSPWDRMELRFFSLYRVEQGGWYGGELLLGNYAGTPMGPPRPFLHYGGPCDVPMHTHFHSPYYGHYVVAMRSAARRPAAGVEPYAPCAHPECADRPVCGRPAPGPAAAPVEKAAA